MMSGEDSHLPLVSPKIDLIATIYYPWFDELDAWLWVVFHQSSIFSQQLRRLLGFNFTDWTPFSPYNPHPYSIFSWRIKVVDNSHPICIFEPLKHFLSFALESNSILDLIDIILVGKMQELILNLIMRSQQSKRTMVERILRTLQQDLRISSNIPQQVHLLFLQYHCTSLISHLAVQQDIVMFVLPLPRAWSHIDNWCLDVIDSCYFEVEEIVVNVDSFDSLLEII